MKLENWEISLIHVATREEWRRKSVSIDKFISKGMDVSIRKELVKSYAMILEKLEKEINLRDRELK